LAFCALDAKQLACVFDRCAGLVESPKAVPYATEALLFLQQRSRVYSLHQDERLLRDRDLLRSAPDALRDRRHRSSSSVGAAVARPIPRQTA
jgi:hypothetical protein